MLLIYSCRKSNNSNWDTDIIFPLVNSQLTLKNFLGDSIFKGDNTHQLILSATRTITAIKLDSLLKLPDTTVVSSFTSPIPFPTQLNPGQSLPFFPPQPLTFNTGNGVAIKTILVRSGQLMAKFSNSLTETLDLTYVISSAIKNGQPLTIFERIPPGVNSLIKTYDLSGYNINLTGQNGFTYNTLVQNYTITLDPAATTSISVNYGNGANAILSYTNVIPDYADGYFGQQTINLNLDTARLNLLSNFQASNFMLNNASLNFRIMNGFGVDLSGNLSNVQSISSTSIVPLVTNQLNTINVNRATRAGNTVFQSVKLISINNGNSNINPFLSNLPSKLTYQGSININPLGNVSSFNDFAFYNQSLNVLADLNIPMNFNANYFKLQSISSASFNKVNQLNNVKSGVLNLNATNGYPFDAILQVYLLDKNKNVIDSLFEPGYNKIAAGQINSSNIVTQPVNSVLKVPISKQKVENLQKTAFIKLVSVFNMPPNPPSIVLYDTYDISIGIVAELIYNVKRN